MNIEYIICQNSSLKVAKNCERRHYNEVVFETICLTKWQRKKDCQI